MAEQHSNFIVRGGIDMTNFTQGLSKAQTQLTVFKTNVTQNFTYTQNKINSWAGGVKKTFGTVAAILGSLAIVGKLKEATNAAISVESSLFQIENSLGRNTAAFNSWVKNQAKSFGMAKQDADQYAAVYSTLVKGFTSDTNTIASYTTDLLKASAVISSRTGRTVDDVMMRIRSGILGDTQAIEDLGIYAQIGAIQATEAFKKLANGKSWAQLDYNTQQQIRVMSILEQTTEKYGNTLADTTATKQMMFLATLKDIRLNIGQIILPIYNLVLPALNAFASKVEAVTATLAELSKALFGQALDFTKNADNQTQAITNTGDAAETAAKQAKKATLAFDELNIVNSNATSGTSGSTSSGGDKNTPGTGTAKKINSSITSMMKNIKKILQPAIEAFGELKKSLKPFSENVGEGLKWFYDNVIVPVGGVVISETIPNFLNTLNQAVSTINTTLGIFKSNDGNGLLGGIVDILGKTRATKGATWLGDIAEAFKSINEFLQGPSPSNWARVLSDMAEAWFDSPFGPGGSLVGSVFEKITGIDLGKWFEEKVKPWFTFEKWDELFSGVNKSVATWGGKILDWFGDLTEPFRKKGGEIIAGIKEGWEIGKALFSAWCSGRFDLVVMWFGSLVGKFIEKGKEIITGIKKGWDDNWKSFKEWLGYRPDDIVGGFGDLYIHFIVKGLDIINGIKKGWNDNSGAFKKWLNGLIPTILDAFGSILSAFVGKGVDIIAGIMRGWNETWVQFSKWLGGLIHNILTSFGNLLDAFIPGGGDIIRGIQKGWDSSWKEFSKWLGELPVRILIAMGSFYDVGVKMITDLIAGFTSMVLPVPGTSSQSTSGTKGTPKIGAQVPTVQMPTNQIGIKQYASGGLPSAGEIYIANENGMSEMIGRIGNRAAVVNQDQISDIIARGNSNSEEIALIREQNALLQAILNKTGITSKDIFNAAKTEADNYFKNTGKLAFEA